jgi:hypothetical protein
MAGTSRLTIRDNLWKEEDLVTIKEITENEIYKFIAYNDIDKIYNKSISSYIDGVLLFPNKNKTISNFKHNNIIKNMCSRFKLFIYDVDIDDVKFWSSFPIQGLIVDIINLEAFKRYEK